MPNSIHLSPNIPLRLALLDPSGVPEDFRVHFPTSDGRVLTLDRKAAVALNLLDLEPGEPFMICKDWDGEQGHPSRIRVWLPAETEQERAAVEAPELECQLARPLDPENQLAGLMVLGYLEELLSASPRESYTKPEMLVILNLLKNDQSVFAPEVLEQYEAICADIECDQAEGSDL